MAGAVVPHEEGPQYVSVVLRVKRKRGTVEEGPPDALVLASKIIKLEEEDKDSNGVGNGTTVDLLVASIFIFVSVDSIFHWCGSYNEDKKEKEDDKPLLVSVCVVIIIINMIRLHPFLVPFWQKGGFVVHYFIVFFLSLFPVGYC